MISLAHDISEIIYLLGIVLFILGIKKLGKVETSRKGNLLSMLGMGLGILTMTFVPLSPDGYDSESLLLIGIVLVMFASGAMIGYIAAVKVKLTELPEMVSILNGLGGLCSMLIGLVEGHMAWQITSNGDHETPLPIILASIVIGSVTVSGSLVAWSKLSGGFFSRIKVPYSQAINVFFLLLNIALVIAILLRVFPIQDDVFFLLAALGLIYGITFVNPIGGGDMPVVISLLNAMSGIAAAFTGLIFDNNFMITGGVLVGASGTFLTFLMCRAMNRSLFNVIVGGFSAVMKEGEGQKDQVVKQVDPSDLAIRLKYSQKVVIVPGYGMAVAQAQQALKELESELNKNGVEVYYAIHPVAGRMPGHMNVLLAEAQVSYDLILGMEAANAQFPGVDIVLVIGANDVVNPEAETNPGSLIYGMPILKVSKAQNVVVLKRSMNPGYSGIENPLFFQENTQMLFGDAKKSLQQLKNAVAEE